MHCHANTFYKQNAFFMLLNVGRVGGCNVSCHFSCLCSRILFYCKALSERVTHNTCLYNFMSSIRCSCMGALILLFSCFLCGLLHHAGEIWLDFRWSPESGLKWTNILQFKYQHMYTFDVHVRANKCWMRIVLLKAFIARDIFLRFLFQL